MLRTSQSRSQSSTTFCPPSEWHIEGSDGWQAWPCRESCGDTAQAIRHRALHANHLATWADQLPNNPLRVKDHRPFIAPRSGNVGSALASLTPAIGERRRRGYIQLRLIAERDQLTRDLYELAGLSPRSQVAFANDLAAKLPPPRTVEMVSHIAFVLDIHPNSVEQYIKRARRKFAPFSGQQSLAA